MPCPRCGGALVETSTGNAVCSCGWDPGEARRAAMRLLFAGAGVDFLGSVLLAVSLVVERSWLPAAVILMAAGISLILAAVLRLARLKTGSKP